jgi:hypothetical protein
VVGAVQTFGVLIISETLRKTAEHTYALFCFSGDQPRLGAEGCIGTETNLKSRRYYDAVERKSPEV